MFSKTSTYFGILTLLAIALIGCTEDPSANIDGEPALAILGGAVLSTQNLGQLASISPKNTLPKQIWKWLDPIPEAFAAGTCPAITAGSCAGTELTAFYDNCEATGFGEAGYWRSYFTYSFPTAGDCTNVVTAGFDATTLAGLVGKTITRTWGRGGPNGDQFNIRLGTNFEATYVYSDYPSGWKDSRQGGIDITFETTTRRRMVVQGAHVTGIAHTENPINPAAFDLTTLNTVTDETTKTAWDHTINTVKTGDPLFELGAVITQLGDGRISFGDYENDTTASFDGDIVVEGNTVRRGATLRVQHNLSESLGVLVVTEPLIYSDPACCWPTSGTAEVKYDLNLKTPTLEEKFVFTGATCGEISYTSSVLEDEIKTLHHCF